MKSLPPEEVPETCPGPPGSPGKGASLPVKGSPRSPPTRTGAGGAALGLLLCGLPPILWGLRILGRYWMVPGTPAFSLAFGLLFVCAGGTVLSLLPGLLELPGQSRRLRRWAHRIGHGSARVMVSLLVVNILLSAYLGLLQSIGPLPGWVIELLVIGCNLGAALAASWTSPRSRIWIPELDERLLLEVHAGALREGVACPYCSSPLDPGEAVCCVRCETLHHADCWRENGRCTTFACGEREAVTLGGSPLDS